MNIVYLDFRPFSHFVRNGFRQRAGRILHHLIRSERVTRLVYVWWNDNPFTGTRDEIPAGTEYKKVLLHEARRARVPFARKLGLDDGWLDKARIRKAAATCKELSGETLWIWATDPRLTVPAKKLADALSGKLCVDLIDNFAVRDEIQGKARETYRKGYQDTVRLANKVVANNSEMQKFLSIPDKKFRFVANGVDWQTFHDGRNLPEPPDTASVSRPRVGFIGILSSLNDVSALNAAAEEITECNVIVVGKTDNVIEPLHKRIHVLGMKPYNEIPAYISSFDVCLSIYQQNAIYRDSQKIKEYLAAGKPVVALNSPQSCIESIYIKEAKDVNEFVCMVRDAIDKPIDIDLKEKISLSVTDQDWQGHITEILDFLEDSNG
jgi:glycosyltransferase involved in cell wall biosynthesis